VEIRVTLLVAALVLPSPAVGQIRYSFTTTAEYVSQCDVASLPGDCLSAVQHVEEVVDYDQDFHPIDDTCDGGPEAMMKSRSNDEMTAWLTERVNRSVAWLKTHPEYNEKSYGDGIWAGLKGAYCR
jgi:hypothetical protein